MTFELPFSLVFARLLRFVRKRGGGGERTGDVLWCWRAGTYGLGLGRARRRMTGSSRSVFCS